jgi:hypothetical protein
MSLEVEHSTNPRSRKGSVTGTRAGAIRGLVQRLASLGVAPNDADENDQPHRAIIGAVRRPSPTAIMAR